MRIAALSDIHGNLAALNAVLEDIKGQGVDLIVTPGSVGLQVYSDNHPIAHSMEAGSPHARYAIVSKGADGWAAEFRAVEYAWDEAAAIAAQRGRADWAVALRTGRMEA